MPSQTLIAAKQRYRKLRELMAEPPALYLLIPVNGDSDAPQMHVSSSVVSLRVELEVIEARKWLREVARAEREEAEKVEVADVGLHP